MGEQVAAGLYKRSLNRVFYIAKSMGLVGEACIQAERTVNESAVKAVPYNWYQ